MKLRFASLLALGLTTVLATGAFAQSAKPASPKTATQSGQKAELGEAAPDFTLYDAHGKAHKLSDYKGKTVVLQWINPDCPVCRRVTSTGIVNTMAKEIKQIDPTVVFLTVNSTHYMEADKSAKYLEKNKVQAPALIDRDGTVGKMYGARTTPHLYVIDAKGVLRYQGALDDDPRGSKGDSRMNYVINAVRQINAGETVAPDSTQPYGCGVKYAKGNRG
jgi:peroxiredoxin